MLRSHTGFILTVYKIRRWLHHTDKSQIFMQLPNFFLDITLQSFPICSHLCGTMTKTWNLPFCEVNRQKCVFVRESADLCVAEGHVLTQSVDVLLTGVVQLRLQADVLWLQRFGEDLVDLQKTQKLLMCAGQEKETDRLKETSQDR